MAKFLVTASYTTEGIRGPGKDGGTVRAEVIRALVENSGGRVEALYLAFGQGQVANELHIRLRMLLSDADGQRPASDAARSSES